MLIVCPGCTSAYEIETERVGASGRTVRCAACRETWFIVPEAAAPALADFDETAFEAAFPQTDATDEAAEPDAGEIIDQPAPFRQGPAMPPPPARAGRRSVLTPAFALGLALFAALPLALLGRSTVVRAMPQSADVFARIGLPVNLRGIDLRDVVAFQNPAEGGRPAELVVEGDLLGVARGRAEVPDIAIAVRDAQGEALYRWTAPSPRAALEPGETARFRASLSAPPAQGRTVEVRFADPKTPEPPAPHVPVAEEARPKEAAASDPAPEAPAHGH